jgi:hypothetical protein
MSLLGLPTNSFLWVVGCLSRGNRAGPRIRAEHSGVRCDAAGELDDPVGRRLFWGRQKPDSYDLRVVDWQGDFRCFSLV